MRDAYGTQRRVHNLSEGILWYSKNNNHILSFKLLIVYKDADSDSMANKLNKWTNTLVDKGMKKKKKKT